MDFYKWWDAASPHDRLILLRKVLGESSERDLAEWASRDTRTLPNFGGLSHSGIHRLGEEYRSKQDSDGRRWIWTSGSIHDEVPGKYSVFVQRDKDGASIQCVSVYDFERHRKYMIGARKKLEVGLILIYTFEHSPNEAIVLALDSHGHQKPKHAYEEATPIKPDELARARELWELSKQACVTDSMDGKKISSEAQNLVIGADKIFAAISC